MNNVSVYSNWGTEHTCAGYAAQAGVPIVRLQKLLGHATAAMTMRYMKHAPEAYIAEDGEAIARHMSGEGDREAAARVEAARGRDEAGVKSRKGACIFAYTRFL